jgi:hypothetical protein
MITTISLRAVFQVVFLLSLVSATACSAAKNPTAVQRHMDLAPQTRIDALLPVTPGCDLKVRRTIRQLTGHSPTLVGASAHGGFVGVIPSGRIWLEYRSMKYEHGQVWPKPNTCLGDLIDVTFLWLQSRYPAVIADPIHNSLAVKASLVNGGTLITATDKRGLMAQARTSLRPKIFDGGNGRFTLRFRDDECENVSVGKVGVVPVEYVEEVTDGPDGPLIRRTNIPDDISCYD